MQKELDNIFGFSELGVAQERTIPKNQFYTQDTFNTAKKNLFTDEIERMSIVAICDRKTTNMEVVINEDERYEEVFFIEVQLRSIGKEKKIGEIIHKTIPNPVVILFTHENQLTVSAAPKRLSKQEHGQVVVESEYYSQWVQTGSEVKDEQVFLTNLNLKTVRFNNLKTFYQDITKNVILSELVEYLGKYVQLKHTDLEELIEQRSKIRTNTEALSALENQQKQLKHFGDKVTNQQKILNAQKQLDTLKQELLALDANNQ